jgi:hypothetical protein
MKLIAISLVSIILLFASCANTENSKLIVGQWFGKQWLVNGQPSNYDAAATSFTFDDKGNYSFTYSNTVEKGTYKVEEDMLFTEPNGQVEMMVKITKLTKDSLVFDMNRGGTAEVLMLTRNK